MALAAVCAGGGARRPATAHIARATEALSGEGTVVATLAGARLEADDMDVRIFREAGEAARGGMAARALGDRAEVWDGRFELSGAGEVRRLTGLARQLPSEQQRALRTFPAAARGALPAVIDPDGAVTCPALTGAPSLIGPRLRAAAGLIDRESP